MNPSNDNFNKKVTDIIAQYLKSSGFSARKVTDTPNDALSTVSRKYVTLNGTVANRPTSSVATIGQHYFATDTGIPMVYTGTNWRNGIGSVVASN